MSSSLSAAICSLLLLLGGEPLKVGAAISLRDVLSEIAAKYEKAGGPHVEWAFGSSGQLVEQIRQGAPLDAIVVASRSFATILEREKLVEAPGFVVVAGNRIVLAAPKAAKSPPKSFEELTDARIKRIAIGDPATVPVGEYAMQVIRSLKLDEKLKDRLVYGTNARQVLAYLQSGEVDAGIVFSTDAASAADSVQEMQIADKSWHQPVEYLAASIRGGKNKAEAAAFIKFVLSDESQSHFEQRRFLSRPLDLRLATSQPVSQPAIGPSSPPEKKPATRPIEVGP